MLLCFNMNPEIHRHRRDFNVQPDTGVQCCDPSTREQRPEEIQGQPSLWETLSHPRSHCLKPNSVFKIKDFKTKQKHITEVDSPQHQTPQRVLVLFSRLDSRSCSRPTSIEQPGPGAPSQLTPVTPSLLFWPYLSSAPSLRPSPTVSSLSACNTLVHTTASLIRGSQWQKAAPSRTRSGFYLAS